MKQSTSNSSKQNQTQPTSIEVWPSSPCLKWKKVILWHPTILFSLFSIQPFSRCSSDTWMWLHWVACLLYNVLCVCSYYHVNSLGSCRSIEERKWSFCEYFQQTWNHPAFLSHSLPAGQLLDSTRQQRFNQHYWLPNKTLCNPPGPSWTLFKSVHFLKRPLFSPSRGWVGGLFSCLLTIFPRKNLIQRGGSDKNKRWILWLLCSYLWVRMKIQHPL